MDFVCAESMRLFCRRWSAFQSAIVRKLAPIEEVDRRCWQRVTRMRGASPAPNRAVNLAHLVGESPIRRR
jgi:hypothetical protein